MGKLGDVATTRLDLPSGDWVEVKKELLLGDIVAMQSAGNDEARGVKGFVAFISDWSFTEDGTPDTAKVPITDESVQQLTSSDVQVIGEYLDKTVKESKQGMSKEEAGFLSQPSTPATETSVPII